MRNNLNLIFDFDSTFIKLEALDELAGISLRNRPNKEQVLDEIKKTTALGMEGAISFPESLSRRFKLLSAKKGNINELIELLKRNVSVSIEANKNFFRNNQNHIYIISGGFSEYICPVVADFGIRAENVLANKFIFDAKENIIGFDKTKKLAQENGKSRSVEELELKGEIWVIGDGYTDYEIRNSGVAHKFIAFCENVRRKNVADKADLTVESMDEFLVNCNKYMLTL